MYIDDHETINTTFSDGAHGEGRIDTKDFVMEKGSTEPTGLQFHLGLVNAIDFTSSFLTADLHAIYLSLMSSQLKSHWTQVILGGSMYQKS